PPHLIRRQRRSQLQDPLAPEPQEPGPEAEAERDLEVAATLGFLREPLELRRFLGASAAGAAAAEGGVTCAPAPREARRDPGREGDDAYPDHDPEDGIAAGNVAAEPVERPGEKMEVPAEPVEHAMQRARDMRALVAARREDPPRLGTCIVGRGHRPPGFQPGGGGQYGGSSGPPEGPGSSTGARPDGCQPGGGGQKGGCSPSGIRTSGGRSEAAPASASRGSTPRRCARRKRSKPSFRTRRSM